MQQYRWANHQYIIYTEIVKTKLQTNRKQNSFFFLLKFLLEILYFMYFHFSCLKNHELHIFAAQLYNGGECCTGHRPNDIPRTVVFLLPQHKALMRFCISIFFTSRAKEAILNVNSFANFIFSNSNLFLPLAFHGLLQHS